MPDTTLTRLPQADSLSESLGDSMYELIRRLYPLNRSITGNGLRETLAVVGNLIDLQVTEIPSGTQVFDWLIPNEWTIRDAYIKDKTGRRVVDFQKHNLHVVNYSIPIHETMPLSELRQKLHSLPEKPDWIPYRTTYYNEDWGFCLSHNDLANLPDGEYEVCIDSELRPGSLTFGECTIKGDVEDEILIFAHACHPSVCNDNLSGVALAAFLADELSKCHTRLSYRFLFAPATIGSISWLSKNESRLPKIKAGLVLSVIGDSGKLVYKQSQRSSALIDRAAEHVLKSIIGDGEIREFTPWGYDERQFCSPGINLPIGRLTRTPNGEYPEYHTSADNLDIVHPSRLLHSLRAVWRIVEVLEGNAVYVNLAGKGEPQLGKRGLYRALGGYDSIAQHQLAMLWVLNQSDGNNSLLDIAIRSGTPFPIIRDIADQLVIANLLKAIDVESRAST